MDLIYPAICLIIWFVFISWITDDADAKRNKYTRTYSRREKAISNIATGVALARGFSKAVGQKQIKSND